MKPVFIALCMACGLLAGVTCKAQLSALFTANITSGCSPIVVNFTDQSGGSPTEWKWDLGNGTLSTLQNPSATYFTPGLYTVKLWIRSANNTDSFVRYSYIQVFNSPVADFNANVISGCNPLTVNFNDRSSIEAGNIVSWQWDFGDGTLSGQSDPQHIYTLVGNYNVTLKAISSNGCAATARKSSFITNSYVKAGFINWSAGGCTPNKILFQNESVGSGNLSYRWDFGDGTFSSAVTPVHVYAGSGNYSIKLVVQNGVCIDSFIKNISITQPAVTASFTSNRTFSCKTPATIQFTNQTAPNTTYYWDFGDGTTSAAANPAHIYGVPGIYSVKYVIKNNGGCADSLVLSNYINVRNTYVNMVTLPDSGCAPFTKHLSAYIDSHDSITGMYWKIGDAVILQDTSPVYTFNNTGSYDVSVITTTSIGCIDTTRISGAITIGEKPTARFSADILNACASEAIHFTDMSLGNITSREWRFGDGTTSYEKNPSHSYKDTGWMTVTLIVSNAGCVDSVTYARYIYIKPPIAKFKTAVDCEQPYWREFENISLGADRWLWDFGDGTTSTEFSPVHIFPRTGNFPVVLKVWNDISGCTNILKRNVKVADARLDFSVNDTNVCKGQSLLFSGRPDPDIMHYYWEFGDNMYADSSGSRAYHSYQSSGTYSVKMLAKDSAGCLDTIVKRDYIIVKGPTAGFGASATDVCVNTPVYFNDLSFGEDPVPIKKWEWSYGDGRIDTTYAPPFLHTYTVSGSYGVSLKVTDSTGCTDAAWLPQRIAAGKINSSFSISDSIACPGYAVKFKCPFNASNITYLWDFGDGTTSPLQNPLHAYNREGVYTVKLYVSKLNSCIDSTIMINALKVKQTKADFTISDSFSTCPPLLVRFNSNSVNAVDERWDFGDSTYSNATTPSHFYVYPGEYKVVHYAKGYGACMDTAKQTIVIKGPTGTITTDLTKTCSPYSYNFIAHTQNTVSYIWDFNDGVTQNGTDSMVNHVYREPGKFVPKMILEDITGCRVPVWSKDTLTNIFVNPYFTFSDSIACNDENISFINLSTGNDSILSYKWDFGDSIISTQKHVSHQYHIPGIYYPSLKMITVSGCVNTYHPPVPVKATTSPSVTMFTSGSGCVPLNVSFTATSNSDPTALKWNWDMGNSDTSILQVPPIKIYNDPGTYTVKLSATNTDGCTGFAENIIHAYPVPATVITGNTFICRGQSLQLSASGAYKYLWQPIPGLNCDTCVTVTSRPIVNTQYILSGTSEYGCSNSDTLNVEVFQPVQLQYNPSVNICAGKSIRLNVSGAATYKWLPVYGLNDASSPDPMAMPDTSVEYTVIGSDMHGCFKDTGNIKVNVHSNPFVNAGDDRTVIAGAPVSLEAAYSGDVTEMYWSPNDNLSRYDQYSITVKPTETTEYTVNAKNSKGCTASDKVTVFVTCNQNNVFVPTLFSPNNDGVNDVFYPRGTGALKVQSLRIFNRWGETVFEKRGFNVNDPSAGWDGTYKGSSLIADVFVYVIDLVCENSRVFSLKGNISLMK